MGDTALTDPSNDPQFIIVGICHTCRHRRGVFTCKAFPQRIPDEILIGEVSHTEPYPGDNGVVFEVLQP